MCCIVLIGGPGAGKGTQATFLKQWLKIPQVSTGDLLRAATRSDSSQGKEIQRIMNAGELISDDIMISLVTDKLSSEECTSGFLLDGYPRTLGQAVALADIATPIDAVINIHVDDDEIVKRMSGRRVHVASGRTYHTEFNPPVNEGIDDVTGETLTQRADDQVETVQSRLRVYHEQTSPVLDFYQDQAESDAAAPAYIEVSGVGNIKSISNVIQTTFTRVIQDRIALQPNKQRCCEWPTQKIAC